MMVIGDKEITQLVMNRGMRAIKKGKDLDKVAFARELVSVLEGFEDLEKFGDYRRIEQGVALIIDIRDSSNRAAQLGAYKTYITIECFLPAMAKLVAFFGGTVVQFTGDGLFALFREGSQPFTRAYWCAGYMMHTVDSIINSFFKYIEALKVNMPQLSCGVGLDIGGCFAVKTGSKKYAVITPYGDCINNASKLSDGEMVIKFTNGFYKFVQYVDGGSFNYLGDEKWIMSWKHFRFPTPENSTWNKEIDLAGI
ncbi:adenylate/guanylate cyclase domain-containing protein [bacterium]|nr:adenylate/guanylate cyclase domain-containing protein [bacterium]